jgi:hypothetical protein
MKNKNTLNIALLLKNKYLILKLNFLENVFNHECMLIIFNDINFLEYNFKKYYLFKFKSDNLVNSTEFFFCINIFYLIIIVFLCK